MLSPERGMLAVGMPSWAGVSKLSTRGTAGWEECCFLKCLVGTCLFAASPETLDDRPAKLERERRLWGVRAGDGIAGTSGADHVS